MSRNQKSVIIIKRPKVVEGGHHGGAWKVAYADFVTAMMAFFLLMWLLSVTDDQTRLGLADYFSPTIPIHSSRGGGDGPFAGATMFSQDILARDETGRESEPGLREGLPAEAEAGDAALDDLANELQGASGDAVEADPLLAHIRTRITDEGLIIDVFDIPGSPLFATDAATPNPILERLLDMIGRVLKRTGNAVAIAGHLAGPDVGAGRPDPWTLSSDRAQFARARLVGAGVTDERLARVTGKADRSPVSDTADDARNRRIEITLLRRFPD
ncbi:flagellar motor protein MotB [Amaricoccus sp.]|uniref:flagellar motor protein MotB n=1 Tax=Amaricoccus sp. TaxID=1872485 RepID=UPI001B5736BD|nr:flagellar motor protein MotB [Amaricoccus sp.]MBP7241717.1 chemotaxis protein MotB [Amaricoccus sp.]